MTLARILAQHDVTARLGRAGKPISAPVTAHSWDDNAGVMSTVVRFGPFVDRVVVDEVLVSFDGGEPEVLRATRDGSSFTLPAGMEWDYTLTLSTETRQD